MRDTLAPTMKGKWYQGYFQSSSSGSSRLAVLVLKKLAENLLLGAVCIEWSSVVANNKRNCMNVIHLLRKSCSLYDFQAVE